MKRLHQLQRHSPRGSALDCMRACCFRPNFKPATKAPLVYVLHLLFHVRRTLLPMTYRTGSATRAHPRTTSENNRCGTTHPPSDCLHWWTYHRIPWERNVTYRGRPPRHFARGSPRNHVCDISYLLTTHFGSYIVPSYCSE